MPLLMAQKKLKPQKNREQLKDHSNTGILDLTLWYMLQIISRILCLITKLSPGSVRSRVWSAGVLCSCC